MLKILLKVGIAGALIAYLVLTGKLDFAQLEIFAQDPRIVAGSVMLYALGYCLLGGFRWHLLMRGAGLAIGFARTLQLQMIGLFFNTVMPGAVGGDLVKAYYTMRESPERKAAAVLVVALDRIIGLVGLILIALVAGLVDLSLVWAIESLRSVLVAVVALLTGIVVLLVLVWHPKALGRERLLRLSEEKSKVARTLGTLYEALVVFRDRKGVVLIAVLMTMVIQGGSMALFWLVTESMTGQAVEPARIAVVLPIGIVLASIPLAPAGLGVGHVAFENLYRLAGLTGGANVFNVVAIGQFCMNLVGVVPYLAFRGQMPPPEELK